jgi:hypothetical protein
LFSILFRNLDISRLTITYQDNDGLRVEQSEMRKTVNLRTGNVDSMLEWEKNTRRWFQPKFHCLLIHRLLGTFWFLFWTTSIKVTQAIFIFFRVFPSYMHLYACHTLTKKSKSSHLNLASLYEWVIMCFFISLLLSHCLFKKSHWLGYSLNSSRLSTDVCLFLSRWQSYY